MVQVDEEGCVIAAAYGAVPADQCPAQTCRDGEDYAVCMLTQLAVEPFVLYIDCQGTLDSMKEPRTASTKASNARANLWGRVWASFNKIIAHKTKGHATAQEARSEAERWQRKANQHADVYAKKGARKHPISQQQIFELDVLQRIAAQAAKWAAWQATAQRQAEVADATEFPEAAAMPAAGPGQARQARLVGSWRASLGHTIREALGQQAPEQAVTHAGHALRIADGRPRALVFCAACGAYATRRPQPLLDQCHGRAAASGRRAQLEMLEGGQHPQVRKGRGCIGEARPAPKAVAEALQCCSARRIAKQPCGKQ